MDVNGYLLHSQLTIVPPTQHFTGVTLVDFLEYIEFSRLDGTFPIVPSLWCSPNNHIYK